MRFTILHLGKEIAVYENNVPEIDSKQPWFYMTTNALKSIFDWDIVCAFMNYYIGNQNQRCIILWIMVFH